MAENLIEFYFNSLYTAKKGGNHIAKFYWELFDLEPNKGDVIMFNKFLKLYSRSVIFFSVVDMAYIDKLDLSKRPYGLIRKIAENRFNQNLGGIGSPTIRDLSSEIKKLKKDIGELKKQTLVFEYPFDNGEEYDEV